MQGLPGRHVEVLDHFPGALVQNSELRDIPGRFQGPQQQPQQERWNHQIDRRSVLDSIDEYAANVMWSSVNYMDLHFSFWPLQV